VARSFEFLVANEYNSVLIHSVDHVLPI